MQVLVWRNLFVKMEPLFQYEVNIAMLLCWLFKVINLFWPMCVFYRDLWLKNNRSLRASVFFDNVTFTIYTVLINVLWFYQNDLLFNCHKWHKGMYSNEEFFLAQIVVRCIVKLMGIIYGTLVRQKSYNAIRYIDCFFKCCFSSQTLHNCYTIKTYNLILNSLLITPQKFFILYHSIPLPHIDFIQHQNTKLQNKSYPK